MWDGGIGRKKNRPIVVTSLGDALEWFDISVYAHLAVYLSKVFFPASDQTTSLLLTFGTFGLTFLARPIGGALLGSRAGRYRRKASLLVSIVMMSAGTLAVALTPTFERLWRHGGGDHDLARQLCPDRRARAGHYLTAVCIPSLAALITIRRTAADCYV